MFTLQLQKTYPCSSTVRKIPTQVFVGSAVSELQPNYQYERQGGEVQYNTTFGVFDTAFYNISISFLLQSVT